MAYDNEMNILNIKLRIDIRTNNWKKSNGNVPKL